MPKFKYEIHRIVTEKYGPFVIESETWLDARVAIMKQLKEVQSEKLTIKLVCKNPFAGTLADPTS